MSWNESYELEAPLLASLGEVTLFSQEALRALVGLVAEVPAETLICSICLSRAAEQPVYCFF